MSTQSEISGTAASAALVFFRCPKEVDSGELYARLAVENGVSGCDAVLGSWDIALRVEAENREALKAMVEKIGTTYATDAIEAHYSEEAPAIQQNNTGKAASYAILDVDSTKLPDLRAKLSSANFVARGDVTDGGKQIILLMRGNSSKKLRDAARNDIRFWPGVLRVKQLDALSFS